jgi:hypothetical protein
LTDEAGLKTFETACGMLYNGKWSFPERDIMTDVCWNLF